MKPTNPYTVVYGDWMAKIAEEHGTTVSEIWNHPHNAEHRAKRGSPDVLYPGDILHLPYEPGPIEQPPPSEPPPQSVPPWVPPIEVTPWVPPIEVPPSHSLPSLGAFALLVDAAPFQQFPVLEFRGEERMSRGFRFDVTALAPAFAYEDFERSMVGRRAAFLFSTTTARLVRGVVYAVRVVGAPVQGNFHPVRFTIVPHLTLLRHRRRSQIFQHLTVAEIAARVLAEAGIETRTSLLLDHPVRAYCTQYEESDLDFVRRILGEAGIFFLLDDPPTDTPLETLVGLVLGDVAIPGPLPTGAPGLVETWLLADSPVAYSSLLDQEAAFLPGGATAHIAYVESNLAGSEPAITRFRRAARLGTTSAVYAEHDPMRPNVSLVAAHKLTPPDGDLPRPATPQGASVELEHYEHHAPYLFPDWNDGQREPQRILRQKRRRTDVAAGAANVPSFAAGRRFILQGHPVDGLNRDYVITRVRHRGTVGPGGAQSHYENDFECVPCNVTFCPSRPRRRSTMVTLTAEVVGPPGEDIYVDPLGQIKVQFHWDRAGGKNDTSSCWVRTMQALAGSGWGSQHIPRVGTEVVVTFEGGDLDKPIVLGSVYDGTHPPPFALPGERTKSGLRTQSSPATSGYNELSFEDRAGGEEIFLHASRDFRAEVTNDHVLQIGNSSRLDVDGSRTERIATDATIEVGKERHLQVAGDSKREILGSETHTVQYGLQQRISGDFDRRVEGTTRQHSSRDVIQEHHANYLQRVRGHRVRIVGTHDAPSSDYVHVEGRHTLFAADRIELTSKTELVLICGESTVRIGPDQIHIFSPKVTMGNTDANLSTSPSGLAAKSKAASLELSATGLLARTREGASVAMAREVKVDGSQILLNSPVEAEDPPPPDPVKPTTITVTDQLGQPVPNQRILVCLGDGTEIPAALDKDGRCVVDLPEDDDDITLSFADLHNVGPK